MTAQRLQLRSYRLAFQLERRIHRIDRFRIPVPYGLPLSAVGWWSGSLVLVLMATRAPVLGPLLEILPWPVRLVLVPAAMARLLCAVGADGRPASERALARLRWEIASQRLVGLERTRRRSRERLDDIAIVPDEGGARFRPAAITGGGAVDVRRPARGLARRRYIELSPGDDRWLTVTRRLELPEGARLVIKCPPR